MKYATVNDVQAGFRDLTADEQSLAEALLEEAAIIIDTYNASADANAKKVVSCRMVRRSLGDSEGFSMPIGSTQGSMSAGGYTQSWTIGSTGTSGELYVSKLEKKLLKTGERMGSHSPLEVIAND